LIFDSSGNLFGLTVEGGGSALCLNGCGTVFRVNKLGRETVLYAFAGGSDGYYPSGGLVRDAAGNLYGVTYGGGAYNAGTIFELEPNGTKTSLYNFTGGNDGGTPGAGLLRDGKGNLYGTTQSGGAYGYGVVFGLTP
jgi:uncharacterized repeat protein (TIGR03803 family)